MSEDHQPDEPTQPLSGWRPPQQSGPSQQFGPPQQSGPPPGAPPQPGWWGRPTPAPPPNPFWAEQQTRPMPQQAPMPGHVPYAFAQESRDKRSLSLGAWLGVAALALVLGLVGGVGGVALHEAIDDGSGSGRVQDGLGGVRTQDAAPLPVENGSVPAVADALLPSTVQILASVEGDQGGATGSGFVLDRDGHIVTNNHVVAGAAKDEGAITVIDHDGERHDASIVGRSAVYDLAVLEVDVEDDASLEPAALGASQGLRVGDPVIAFGSPLGLSQTVTSGIVSALDRPVTTSGDEDDDASYINAVQTDAAINPGNSGGPLVNLAGEVVGVNSAIATTGGGFGGESGNIGVGFAIPIEQVRTTVDQILRTGEAQYPVIGATVRTGGDPVEVGAEITRVTSGSPAERAGLEEADLVTAVDGEPVTDGIALIVAIRTHVPGDQIELTVQRGDRERTFEVELDGEVG